MAALLDIEPHLEGVEDGLAVRLAPLEMLGRAEHVVLARGALEKWAKGPGDAA